MPIVKLSYEQVIEIREYQGLLGSKTVGEMYNISPRQIRRIWNNTRWNKELYEEIRNGSQV